MTLKQLESLAREMVLSGKGHLEVVDKDGKSINTLEPIIMRGAGKPDADIVVIR